MNEYVKFYRPIGGGGGGSSNNDDEAGGDTSAGVVDGKTPEEVSEDIFNNYGNLADSVKTKLNTMIAEIAEDCMGKELLSQLTKNGIAVRISFASYGNSHFTPNTNNITMVNNHSEGLLHELFHVLQLKMKANNNVEAFVNAEVNHEVEAYIATYAYMKRNIELSNMGSRLNTFVLSYFGDSISFFESIWTDMDSYAEGTFSANYLEFLFEEAVWDYIDDIKPTAIYNDAISINDNLLLIKQLKC